jgi:hypothetical protein
MMPKQFFGPTSGNRMTERRTAELERICRDVCLKQGHMYAQTGRTYTKGDTGNRFVRAALYTVFFCRRCAKTIEVLVRPQLEYRFPPSRYERYISRWRQDALSLTFSDEQVKRWIDEVLVPAMVREYLEGKT